MLNAVLTVTEGHANSHRKKGWETFTEAALQNINALPGPVVFLCLGLKAQTLAKKIVDQSKHTLINEPHPSGQNGTEFVDQAKVDRPFTKTNQILSRSGRGTIDWALP